jgi:N-methylhydantoinase B
LTDRRRHAPRGSHGGEDGAPGRNRLNGETLPPKKDLEVKEGDVISIVTPGGGGWGR